MDLTDPRNLTGPTRVSVAEASDTELLDMVRHGDPAGGTELFERYSGPLLRFTDRMLANRAEAEEVTQEVFVKMIARAGQHDGRAAVSAWLFAIAANACRDRFRRGKRVTIVPLEAVAEPAAGEATDGRLFERERRQAVRRALASLSEEQREVLVLARYHEMPYVEIAHALEISEGAVKTRMFRAMERLKGILLKGDGTCAAKNS